VPNVDPFGKLTMPSRAAKTARRAAERIEAEQLLSVLTDPDRA